MDGPQDKHALNEKLCRFWVQNCGKLINEVPACIAEMGSQVWVTAHMLYAVVSVAPTICSPSGSTMAPEQRQLLVNSLSQHLLPRIQLCAEQALSYMPEAAIQESLRELSRCETTRKKTCFLHLSSPCVSLSVQNIVDSINLQRKTDLIKNPASQDQLFHST